MDTEFLAIILTFIAVLVYPIITGYWVKHLNRKDKAEENQKLNALMIAFRTSRRIEIKSLYKRVKRRGYITMDELDDMECTYRDYRKLEGNYYVEDIMSEVRKMQVRETDVKLPKSAKQKINKQRRNGYDN